MVYYTAEQNAMSDIAAIVLKLFSEFSPYEKIMWP